MTVESLGGTESAVIRLAEGFASLGLEVAVIQPFEFEPILGQYAFFLPASWLDKIDPACVIHLRSIAHLDKFPKARNFVWLHDVPDNRIKDWVQPVKDTQSKIICVSQWHRDKVREITPDMPVTYLYSPIDEECYLPKEARPQINKNQMVWMSSPHKGLNEALDTFKKLKLELPDITLTVMNPGYFYMLAPKIPGVSYAGELPRPNMRRLVASSLCLFYPTKFEETFGAVTSEANAMGVPVATYKVAALAESVSPYNGWCKDEDDLINTIKAWYKERPEVHGQHQYRLKAVVPKWINELGSKLTSNG